MRSIYRAGLRFLTDKQLCERHAALLVTCIDVEAEYEKRPLAQRAKPLFGCHEQLADVVAELRKRGVK